METAREVGQVATLHTTGTRSHPTPSWMIVELTRAYSQMSGLRVASVKRGSLPAKHYLSFLAITQNEKLQLVPQS
eukprot:3200696-Amphidinium_carterae.1